MKFVYLCIYLSVSLFLMHGHILVMLACCLLFVELRSMCHCNLLLLPQWISCIYHIIGYGRHCADAQCYESVNLFVQNLAKY